MASCGFCCASLKRGSELHQMLSHQLGSDEACLLSLAASDSLPSFEDAMNPPCKKFTAKIGLKLKTLPLRSSKEAPSRCVSAYLVITRDWSTAPCYTRSVHFLLRLEKSVWEVFASLDFHLMLWPCFHVYGCLQYVANTTFKLKTWTFIWVWVDFLWGPSLRVNNPKGRILIQSSYKSVSFSSVGTQWAYLTILLKGC